MTNLERIRQMPKEELLRFMKSLYGLEAAKYIDFDAWFDSEDETYIIPGIPGRYREHGPYDHGGDLVPCIIVEERKMYGLPYRTVITRADTKSPKVANFPAEWVIQDTDRQDKAPQRNESIPTGEFMGV